MSDSAYPAHHPVQQVDTAHGYITEAVASLQSQGIRVDRSHLDPMGPVDATIIFGDNALVWDEWTGWRVGTYVSGRQGERTVLKDARHLGGGVLLSLLDLAAMVGSGTSKPLTTREANASDGLFDALRNYRA
ncbi:hypothetical protein [Actinomadura sp. B10D3]|uniref:hypothetical protein n=1 Tax=Actinomadura sp. B10D3 TaxID=3153557 RepID=UPI00325EF821